MLIYANQCQLHNYYLKYCLYVNKEGQKTKFQNTKEGWITKKNSFPEGCVQFLQPVNCLKSFPDFCFHQWNPIYRHKLNRISTIRLVSDVSYSILLYTKFQGSVFLFSYWTKSHHVSCSHCVAMVARVTFLRVNNQTESGACVL